MTKNLTDAQSSFIDEEFLKLGAEQNVRVLAGVMAASAILAWIAALEVGAVAATAWLGIVGLTQFVRVKVESRAANQACAPLNARLRWRIAVAALCGAIQALCLIAFPLLAVAERSFYSLVLLGLATGAVANSAGHFRTVVAYAAPMVLPLVVLWPLYAPAGSSAWLGPALGVLIIFYAGVLLGFAESAWRTFDDSCRIRFRDVELNERLRSALEVAEGANRAKTRFLAAASHDLRQPLHTMVLLTSALSLRQLDPRSTGIVKLLGEVTETLSSQLDDLLDISKLDAGVVEVNRRTVAVTEVMAHHFAEMEAVIAARGLSAHLRGSSPSFVSTDPQLLARILRNLTHNAVKFTDQGSVTLEVMDEGDEVVIAVQDTGRGIPSQQHEDVFLEFFQAGNPERDRSKGLGLGLSIVKRLAGLLGIRISMQSQPSIGSRFELRLVRTSSSASATPAASRGSSREAFDLHVLVVDDETSVRASMRILLEELGCDCAEASSTEQARERAAVRRPDLVLADFRLRESDSGLLTLDAVDAVCGPVPGVLVSGDTAPERLREARGAGRRMLHKPLSLDDLKQELQVARAAKTGQEGRSHDSRPTETR